MSTTQCKTRLWSLMTLVAALLVAMGLSLAAQAPAYADEGEGDGVGVGASATVALTVVNEMDNDLVVYNGEITGLTTENTVAEMLTAAGFTKAEEYDGNRYTYVETYDSPYFMGLGYSMETGAYWVTIYDGSSVNYASALLESKLQDGGHYQYVYTNRIDETWTTTFEYTAAIPDPLTTEVPKMNQLLNNLAKRFGKGGADSAIAKGTYGAALALCYLRMDDQVDADAIAKNAADPASADSAGAMAKYVMALASAGVDVTSYVAQMEGLEADYETTYSTPLILAAYNLTGLEPAKSAKLDQAALVTGMLDDQADSGLFPKEWSSVQSTAQVMFALAPFKGSATYEAVGPALTKARAAAVAEIAPDGTIPVNPMWSQAAMDYDAMGEFIDALVEYTGGVSVESKAMANALLAGANDTLDGYTNDENVFDETIAAATAFRGLAAAFADDENSVHLNNVVDARADIADAEAAAISKTFTGAAVNPVPAVTYMGGDLEEGVDFTVSYADANKNDIEAADVVNAGAYFIKLTGVGNFQGVKYVDLTVNKAKITKATAEKIANHKYDGKKYNPVPVLTYKKVVLEKGNDFKLSYTDKNKNDIKAKQVKAVGTYYAKAVGKGNFKGTTYVKFKITK